MKATACLLIILIFSLGLNVIEQNLPVIKPVVLGSNDYSKESYVTWQRTIDLYLKINAGEEKYGDNLKEYERNMIDSLEMGYGPLSEGVGCSWYCGGGPYKVTSSTYLEDQGKINYQPDNIHDFNLFTAWIPDHSGGAIGKRINFHFKPFAPRVNEIFIWNGYIKNSDLWKANSRVAKFKLIINGQPKAILELQDVTNTQSFKIDPIQSVDSIKDLVLTLEIIEVYKGSKYEDVVVSEINFSGIDVHCFGAGTEITMADGSTKRIEKVSSNDWVKSYNLETGILRNTKVSDVIVARHTNLLKLCFLEREIVVTDDHPFWIEGGIWASINPEKSNFSYEHTSEVVKLRIGDKVFIPADNKFVDLVSVERLEGDFLTYTLNLTSGDNFIANGLMVKTENTKWTN